MPCLPTCKPHLTEAKPAEKPLSFLQQVWSRKEGEGAPGHQVQRLGVPRLQPPWPATASAEARAVQVAEQDATRSCLFDLAMTLADKLWAQVQISMSPSLCLVAEHGVSGK